MKDMHGNRMYDPDDPREGPDGWSKPEVDTDPDNEDSMCVVTFRHENGAKCIIYQFDYESYSLVIEAPDGEDIGLRVGTTTDAMRSAAFAMESYTLAQD